VPEAKIVSISGEVKIRRGVEEDWHHAAVGMLLETLDTILTLERAEVVLELNDGATFRLGSNAMLDVADLRKITERELFLYLMSEKIGKIPPRQEKTRLRVADVSVVHGESKAKSTGNAAGNSDDNRWVQEANGAKALYAQQYFPNAVVRLHKILAKYPDLNDCGEIYFLLGNAFEALNKPGQAIDAYQVVIEKSKEAACDGSEAKYWIEEAQKAMERLKP
jgi:tetratricopeptide (TPR) repeat protein